jgi:two-component system response regulator HydG
MEMMLKYAWPGNVRELENAMERAVILMIGDHVTEKELPLSIAHHYAQAHPDINTRPVPLQTGMRSLEEIEKEAVLSTLRATNGNKSETARHLGITRKTLHNKLKRFGEGH